MVAAASPPWLECLTVPSTRSNLPPERPPLTTAQQETYNSLLSHFSSKDLVLPSSLKTLKSRRPAPAAADERESEGWRGLSEEEACFLSEDSLKRYLRAVKWDLKAGIARVEETVVWRREYGVETLSAEEVEEESKTGKQFVFGYDSFSRPCLHMYPFRQNTKVSPRQIQFVVWCLERAIDLMPQGVEGLCLCIDFGSGNAKRFGGQPTTLGQARQVLQILQTYYAERLSLALCINVPFLFWSFYKLVGPFVDPATKSKIRFNPGESEREECVPAERRDKACWGGEVEFEYEHDTYWPELVKLAASRHAQRLARHRELGGGVGLKEWDIKSPTEDSASVQPSSSATSVNTATDADAIVPGKEAGKLNGVQVVGDVEDANSRAIPA